MARHENTAVELHSVGPSSRPGSHGRTWRIKRETMLTFERWVDWIVDILATPTFVAAQTIVILGYAFLNSVLLGNAFDPYPYIFLNLLLSMSSAYTSSFVLNSQRRQDRQTAGTSQSILSSLEALRSELNAAERRLDYREAQLAERERLLTEVLKQVHSMTRNESATRAERRSNGPAPFSVSLVRDVSAPHPAGEATHTDQQELTSGFCRE